MKSRGSKALSLRFMTFAEQFYTSFPREVYVPGTLGTRVQEKGALTPPPGSNQQVGNWNSVGMELRPKCNLKLGYGTDGPMTTTWSQEKFI